MPNADSASGPDATALRVGLLMSDAVTRQLLGLLLQRLEAAPPVIVEDLDAAGRFIAEATPALLIVGIDPPGHPDVDADADVARLAPLATLAAIGRAQAPGAIRLVALIRDPADDERCRAAGADATLPHPPRLAALRAVMAASPTVEPPTDFVPGALHDLQRLYGDAGLAEVVGALIADLPVQQARADAAIAAGDLAALGRIAHALRGTSLQLGADALAARCAEVEAQACAGDRARTSADVRGLLARHERLVAAVWRHGAILAAAPTTAAASAAAGDIGR